MGDVNVFYFVERVQTVIIVIILYMWFFYTLGLEFDINLTVYLGDTNL